LADVPKEVVLGELESEYEPVVFAHRMHAEMSAMGGECEICHHFTSGGGIAACVDCHPTGAAEDIRQPGLKAAYHRQCLSCHEGWSGGTACDVCHIKKTVPGAALQSPSAPHHERVFKPVEAPDKKVWHSTFEGGTVVTLHHKSHVERYGIDCAACHHAEGCKSCHGQGKIIEQPVQSEHVIHATCNACHAEMTCSQCHLEDEAPEFSHDRTGWPLGKFHQRLACRACHGNPYHFTRPNSACDACHSRWNQGDFDHTVTGLDLSETHRQFECISCHPSRAFASAPTCTECHGEDIAFPAQLPGARTELKK
jgi:hypothetical protein